ncbi:hypothetical protein BSKO_01880 [Bryopsis sp. KO-2023]|nr:hypothetical protein BSKO_01880 [Bryopsis sp. KO-2023]
MDSRPASPNRPSDIEDELFRGSDVMEIPTIMAATINFVDGERTVGAAYVDLSTRRMGACQFHDDMDFCCLETLIVQLGPRECVLPKASESSLQFKELPKVNEVLSRCGAVATDRPTNIFSTKNLEGDLKWLIKSGSVEHHRDILERPLASQALAAVIAFSELAASTYRGRLELSLHDIGSSMRLDSAAQRALNLFPQKNDDNKVLSVYGLLNRARTAMGKRKLKVWMKQPLVKEDDVKMRLDIVETFVENTELREQIRDCLRGYPDVERLTRKLSRKKCSLADLCQLYRASSKLPLLEHHIKHAGVELLNSKYASQLADVHDLEHLGKFEQLVEAAVDLDKVPDEYLISPDYSKDLEGLSVKKREIEASIDDLFHEAAADLGLIVGKTIKLEWHRFNNNTVRCLRITQKEERSLRQKLQQRYLTLETKKDGTKFVSHKMQRAATELQSISHKYQSMQTELVSMVIDIAHTFVRVFEEAAVIISELDVLAGLADIAISAPVPYVRPQILAPESGELMLRGCRHPLVEAQDGVDFIKNDCEMVRGESWFQVITGPNMGGKSTFIRQVGISVLLAQIGSFVPCDEARIALRDAIFARVGAGDCQLRGVSTFMAEMLETAAILKGATERSLVIVDELGRGTSTYDGFGLAWAISHHIMQKIGCPTLFATHFHELTALTGPGGVKNLHAETCIDSDTGRLTMLYKVSEGACDQSFGIHVAECAMFPESVVAVAKERLREFDEREKQLTQYVWEKSDKEKAAHRIMDEFMNEVASIETENTPRDDLADRVKSILAKMDAASEKNEALKELLSSRA